MASRKPKLDAPRSQERRVHPSEEAGDKPAQERRRQARRGRERRPIQVAVTLTTGKDLTLHATTDLSAGGFFAEAIPYPVGTLVKVRFELPLEKAPVECAGEVVNAETTHKLGMGIKFQDLSPEDAARIELFVAEAVPPA